MNFITFVLSLLLIFSIGTFVALEKQAGNRRLRNTYLGHVAANRKILSKWESEVYKSLRGEPSSPKKKGLHTTSEKTKKEHKIPLVNPECARLNLWPLIQEGREEHPFLYATALKFLETFYASSLFSEKPQEQALFLNDFLKKAKLAIQKNQFSMETLSLDPRFQILYYQMLKGTKQWDLLQKMGYPSLLDIVKVEEHPSKICLSHALPGPIAALFNPKAALLLYQEIHKESPPLLTRELIEKICADSHLIMLDPEVFNLIDLKNPAHAKERKTTLVAEDADTKISLRKTIYTRRESAKSS